MATEAAVSLQVNTVVSNLPQNLEFTNSISIDLHEEIEELMEDENGIVTLLRSYEAPPPPNPHILLEEPSDFTEHHLSQLLRDQEVPQSQDLGRIISLGVSRSLGNDKSLQEPLFVKVNVVFIKERFVVLPPVSSAQSRGALDDVLQRFVEEQRVELKDLEKGNETCSICIEKFSKSHKNIMTMPRCLHLFHQDCLFEWLKRKNSCPLCRGVPYEEDQETET